MKAILIFSVLLVIVCAIPLSTNQNNKVIEFDLDLYEESPLSFTMKGQIDPLNDQKNKIEMFLRLAGQYIPILESLASQENSLQFQRRYNFHILGINVDVLFYLQLMVGWEVNPGKPVEGRFDVVYIPFIWGSAATTTNGTVWLANGGAETTLEFISARAPISLSLYQNGKVCFSSKYSIGPVQTSGNFDASLLECQDEILDDLINGNPIFVWSCNMIDQVFINLWDYDFYSGTKGDIIGETCFNF